MAKQVKKKYGWVLENFSSLQDETVCSVQFLTGDLKWRLVAYPKGNRWIEHGDFFYLYLEAADLESLPCGWKIYVEYRFTIVNQCFPNHTIQREAVHWFDKKISRFGISMIPLFELNDINGGYLLNEELLIVAEVEVLEVISTLDTSQAEEISDNSEQRDHGYSSPSEDLQNKDDVTIEVKGFQVLGSQVNQVKEIFEKHPDLTSKFDLKNQEIKNAYMYALLDLINTLCKAPNELTEEDLNKADDTLSDLIKSGFNLDWLRQKMDQALEKQIAYDTRIRELEKQVKKRKLALTELEADLEKEKAAASAAVMLFD